MRAGVDITEADARDDEVRRAAEVKHTTAQTNVAAARPERRRKNRPNFAAGQDRLIGARADSSRTEANGKLARAEVQGSVREEEVFGGAADASERPIGTEATRRT